MWVDLFIRGSCGSSALRSALVTDGRAKVLVRGAAPYRLSLVIFIWPFTPGGLMTPTATSGALQHPPCAHGFKLAFIDLDTWRA